MCKYNLEKRVKEQEKKLEVQVVSGGLSDNQLIEVEQLAARMKKRLADLVRQVDRLDKNGEILSPVTSTNVNSPMTRQGQVTFTIFKGKNDK